MKELMKRKEIKSLVKRLKKKDPVAWILAGILSIISLMVISAVLKNIVVIAIIGSLTFLVYFKIKHKERKNDTQSKIR